MRRDFIKNYSLGYNNILLLSKNVTVEEINNNIQTFKIISRYNDIKRAEAMKRIKTYITPVYLK